MDTAPLSLAQHYASSQMYKDFDIEVLPPTPKGIELFRAKQDTFAGTDPAMPRLQFFSVTKAADDFRGAFRYDEGWQKINCGVSDVRIEAGNCEREYDIQGTHELLVADVPFAFLASAFGVELAVFEAVHHVFDGVPMAHNPNNVITIALGLMNQMWRASEARCPSSPMLVESGTIALASLLFGHRLPIKPQTQLKLSDPRLLRVIDYIEARIGEVLRLEELAAVACISPYHFARSFKVATGLTPHNYVQSRRITRAKELLARTRLPIAQVAADVGFASQAHMTDVFRNRVGVSPAKYRSDRA
jgi:AraC-like DNA-binding protein